MANDPKNPTAADAAKKTKTDKPKGEKKVKPFDGVLARAFLLMFVQRRIKSQYPVRAINVVRQALGRMTPQGVDALEALFSAGLVKGMQEVKEGGKKGNFKQALILPLDSYPTDYNPYAIADQSVMGAATEKALSA